MALRDKVLALLPGRKPAPGPDASAALSKPAQRDPYVAQRADGGPTRMFEDPGWSKARIAPRSQRVGAPGTAILIGRVRYEEWNAALENERGYGRWSAQGVFDKMRRTDPEIRRSLQLLKLPIRAAKWIFEPADDTDEAKEHADFLSYCLFERLAWDRILSQSLLMFDFGFSLFEVLEDGEEVPRARFPGLVSEKGPGRPAKGETTPAIVWSGVEARLPKTVWRWKASVENPEHVEAVLQYVGLDDNNDEMFKAIPGDRLLRFTHEQEGANFQGVSVLRTAYKPWLIMDQLQRLDAIRHERQNVGIPVITLPDAIAGDTNAEAKADEILSHLASHEQGYVTLPSGWKLEWLTTTKGEGTDVNEAIERCKREIADNILAGFMALGNGDTGSYALAETQADQYLLNLEATARYIEEVWNKGNDGWSPVRRLIDLNYGPQEKYPQLKATNLKSRDYGQILPLVGELIRYGAITPDRDLENFLRTRLDLPADMVEAEEELDDTGDTPDDESDNPDQPDMTAAEADQPLPPPPPPTTSRGSGKGAPAPSPAKATAARRNRAIAAAARVYAELMGDQHA